MAAHPNTPIDDRAWIDVPPGARPRNSIAISDDAIVGKIVAERRRLHAARPWYEIVIRGD